MLLRSQKNKSSPSPNKLNIDEFIRNSQLKGSSLAQNHIEKLPLLQVQFSRVINDSSRQNFRKLICLKCIISQQLPKMPRSYITKMLFDGRHECIVIEVSEIGVIGGVCFRCFEGQQFVEIVFLAIEQSYKKRRFGSRLIDNLKELMQERKKNLLLTYADNTAVGFFRKQGFQVIVETPEKAWSGFIKVYLQGTLMECKIYDNLKYTKFQETVREQKARLIDKIKSVLKNQIKYPGLLVQRLKQSYQMMDNQEDSRASLPFPIELIPGVIEARWSTHQERRLQQTPEISIMLQQLHPIECIRKHSHSKVFRGLTALISAPKYQNHFILELPTLQKKIISGKYLGDTKGLCRQYISMIRDYKIELDKDSDDYKDICSLQDKIGPILISLSQLKIRIKLQSLFREQVARVKKDRNLKI